MNNDELSWDDRLGDGEKGTTDETGGFGTKNVDGNANSSKVFGTRKEYFSEKNQKKSNDD